MLAQILVHGTVLVKQDHYNTALSFTVKPVVISTLHVICDAVGTWIPVTTDKGSTITLLGEGLENTVDNWSSTHNVVLYPGNGRFEVTVTNNNPT